MSTDDIKELISAIKQSEKTWLDIDEMETDFRILKSTQSKMRMAKTLPYHKIGKYVRYHRPDIEQMFQDAKVV